MMVHRREGKGRLFAHTKSSDLCQTEGRVIELFFQKNACACDIPNKLRAS